MSGISLDSYRRSKILCKKALLFISAVFVIFLVKMQEVSADSPRRSTSLIQISSQEGDVERVDYVDENGTITYAVDKHYATKIKKKAKNTILERFYDANGNPAEQVLGNYALLREYDDNGNNYKVTYLGIDEEPIIIHSGYSFLVRTFYPNGKVKTEQYYDLNGQPIETYPFAYGAYNEYDEFGRNIEVTYMDCNSNPMMSGQGFAIIRKRFYDKGKNRGKVKEEFYFDPDNDPISLSHGQYGVHKEYDELGRVNEITYLDAKGLPTKSLEGYTIVKKTFYEDDSVRTEMYYDQNGNPVELSEGQYGVLYLNGERIYLSADGKKQFNIKNYLHKHYWLTFLIAIVLIMLSHIGGKKVNTILLVMYIVFIIYMTLMFRAGTGRKLNLELFWSYRRFLDNSSLRVSIIKNIVLFIPLGAFLYRLYPKYMVILLAVMISIFIEVMQYAIGVGMCEFDDVFSNGTGAIIGYFVALILTSVFSIIYPKTG